MTFLTRLATLLLFLTAAPMTLWAQDEAEIPNLLNLARGGVLVQADVDPVKSLALTDGDPASAWSSSTKKHQPPYGFTLELIAPATLTRVGISGAGERPGGVAGGSAGTVVVEASGESAAAGFAEIARFDAAAEGDTLVDVAPPGPVRWLRFSVLGTIAPDAAWIYFTEVIAQGSVVVPDDADRFTGVFQTGRKDLLELTQNGSSIDGCFVENSGRSHGTVTGSVAEGVALLNWRSDQGVTGTAFLTVDSTGALAGVRYRQRSRSPWGGPVAAAGSTTPCSDLPPTNPILAALEAEGEARIYGILFEFDSDIPKASSAAALRQLYEALAADPALNVLIEGHTDAQGADDYNLDLSDRRAASVVGWLVEQGIAAERLQGAGRGETEPVASNDTADGRALNRRVDVVRQ